MFLIVPSQLVALHLLQVADLVEQGELTGDLCLLSVCHLQTSLHICDLLAQFLNLTILDLELSRVASLAFLHRHVRTTIGVPILSQLVHLLVRRRSRRVRVLGVD